MMLSANSRCSGLAAVHSVGILSSYMINKFKSLVYFSLYRVLSQVENDASRVRPTNTRRKADMLLGTRLSRLGLLLAVCTAHESRNSGKFPTSTQQQLTCLTKSMNRTINLPLNLMRVKFFFVEKLLLFFLLNYDREKIVKFQDS